ncbi:MAG: prepilin-type N-terminal cleavage/methylation domain-containing protein [Patescibacteria group bacterium]
MSHVTSHKSSPAFTLVEMLIASSLFAMLTSLVLVFFINTSRVSGAFNDKQVLFDDGEFLMNKLVREISNSSIDYEEYFNRLVIGGDFGMNFGQYASQFYYSDQVAKGKQNHCDVLQSSDGKDAAAENCVNTGRNPVRTDLLPGEGNAFMVPNQDISANQSKSLASEKKIFCDDFSALNELKINKRNYVCVKHLYLVSPEGDRKILIAPEKFTITASDESSKDAHVLSLAEMITKEQTTEGQSNTVKYDKIFTCSKDVCTKDGSVKPMNTKNSTADLSVKVPDVEDLADGDDTHDKNFIPISSKRIDVISAEFFISPVEDPLKAYSEGEDPLKGFSEKEMNAKYFLHQPTVTIVLEIQPIANLVNGKNSPRIRLEKKVTPAVFEEVKSYPPHMECIGAGCDAIRMQ